jgi:hypothetical protein
MNIIKDGSPDLSKGHSESMQLNIESYLPPDRGSLRMRGKHIKTLFSQ